MKNKYFALRHGTSLANEEGIIISDPVVGIQFYGLTDDGKLEVYESVSSSELELGNPDIIICSSDFKRARESGGIGGEVLEVEYVILTPQLRERWFGDFECTSNSNYEKVWEIDEVNPNHKKYGVESVIEVRDRAKSLITDMEELHKGKIIILSSHGDTLQILQTDFSGVDPRFHRKLEHLETGELREYMKS